MRATFVYDGDCAFCSSCARFAQRWIPTGATIAPWQRTDLAALGLTEAECDGAVQWVAPSSATRVPSPDASATSLAGPDASATSLAGPDASATSLAGPDAIAALLRSSHRGWRAAGWLLALRPVRALAWPTYRWVARNRHRMPGGTAACVLPATQR